MKKKKVGRPKKYIYAHCNVCNKWYINGKWKESGFVIEWLEISEASKKGQILFGICKECKRKKETKH